MDKNREVAEAIETDWEARGMPTFKAFLREDLARRKAGAAAITGGEIRPAGK
jgi:hypothetical protein